MNTLIQFNDAMGHAPAGVIAMLFAIALGYVLKTARFFNNRLIPVIVVPVTSIVYSLIQVSEHLMTDGPHHPWLYLVFNLALGFIYGAFAWLLHAQILKRFVDPSFFNDDGSTKFFNKPNVPANPPGNQPNNP